MTLHDLRGLIDMDISIQDVNIIISARADTHGFDQQITVSGDVEEVTR